MATPITVVIIARGHSFLPLERCAPLSVNEMLPALVWELSGSAKSKKKFPNDVFDTCKFVFPSIISRLRDLRE